MKIPPILLITYNRPQYALLQLEALRKVRPSIIYLASDAARNKNDDLLVQQTRKFYLENIDWDCKTSTLFHKKNLGCFAGPIEALKWFFSKEIEGIILEDDIIPHPHFFRFVSEMLLEFRENKKIISISGCNMGFNGDANSFLFSRIMNMWGWATWRDRFLQVDFTMQKWKEIKKPSSFLYSRLRNHLLDFDINWYRFWKEKWDRSLKENAKITWWDYQFIFSQVLLKQLSIFPTRNLISNIGFDSDATHTVHSNDHRSNLDLYELEFPLKKPSTIRPDYEFEENFIKKIWAEYTRPSLGYYLSKILD